MTIADFPATFSQFKEGSQPINEAKAPEWLDAKAKTKEVDISNDDRPKTNPYTTTDRQENVTIYKQGQNHSRPDYNQKMKTQKERASDENLTTSKQQNLSDPS